MKLKKRKIKYSAIFFLCWFSVLVLLVDGILKFHTLVDYFGSYALVEITLLLLVIMPTMVVYKLTKECKTMCKRELNEQREQSQTCLNFAESRVKKSKTQNIQANKGRLRNRTVRHRMTLPKLIICKDGTFRLGMVRSATKGDLWLTSIPSGALRMTDNCQMK